MKFKKLVIYMAAGMMMAFSFNFATTTSAHGDEIEDEIEDQASTPANSPSSDDSSSSIPSQSAKVSPSNSLKQIEMVEVENEARGSGSLFGSLLADDSSTKTVALRVKNGKVLQVVKFKDATGKVTESVSELKTTSVIAVSGHDSSGKASKLKIRFNNGHFELEQAGIKILSNFPITIDPSSNSISIVTPAGPVALRGLHVAAINELKQRRLFTNLDEIELENENKADNVQKPEDVDVSSEFKTPPLSEKLIIRISAYKTVKLFNLIPLQAPITLKLAPDTGTVATTTQPWYLNWLGVLFSR
jgi:hypothetical protein